MKRRPQSVAIPTVKSGCGERSLAKRDFFNRADGPARGDNFKKLFEMGLGPAQALAVAFRVRSVATLLGTIWNLGLSEGLTNATKT